MSFPINRDAARLHAQELKEVRDKIDAFLRGYDPNTFMNGTSVYAHPRLSKNDLNPIVSELMHAGWYAELRKEVRFDGPRHYWIFIC